MESGTSSAAEKRTCQRSSTAIQIDTLVHWMHTCRMLKLVLSCVLASVAITFSGCVSTEALPYQGGGVFVGQEGAAKNVNGIDFWLTGSPPRKFQIVGYIQDSRPNRGIPLLTMYPDLAKAAKSLGGDGVLIQSESIQYAGSVSSGNTFVSPLGSGLVATGSGISVPLTQREGHFLVIKYL
jgi:hypothetical protein